MPPASSSCWPRTMGRGPARTAPRITVCSGCRCSRPIPALKAAHRGEPVVFSAVRPATPVLKRGDSVPPAIEAIHGAYVFRAFRENGKQKLVLAISGGQVMANVLEILPDIEERADVKIVAVTSPQLYEELCQRNPAKAHEILSDDERRYVVTLHNGWRSSS